MIAIYFRSLKTTVFKSGGNSLALRLPKGFELPLRQVEIRREGNSIIVELSANGWPVNLSGMFPADPDLEDWKREPQPPTPAGKEW